MDYNWTINWDSLTCCIRPNSDSFLIFSGDHLEVLSVESESISTSIAHIEQLEVKQIHLFIFINFTEFTYGSEEARGLGRNLTGLLAGNWTQKDECYMHYEYGGFEYQAPSEPGRSGFSIEDTNRESDSVELDTKPVLLGNNYGHLILHDLPHRKLGLFTISYTIIRFLLVTCKNAAFKFTPRHMNRANSYTSINRLPI